MDNDDVDERRRKRFMVNATSDQHSVIMSKGNKVPIICLDDDDDEGRSRFVVNVTSESVMSKGNNVPIICLDDDDDDDDDVKSGPLFETSVNYLDTSLRYEESETQIFSSDSNIGNGNPVVITQGTEHKTRVSQERERKNLELKAQIERDNRVAERRKRKIAESESVRRDNKVRRKMFEFEVENLIRDVALVSDQKYIQQDSNVGKFSELEVETLRDASLVSDQESFQEDNNVVRLTSNATSVSDQEDIQQVNNDWIFSEFETLSDVTLVSDQDYMQQDSNVGIYSVLEVEPLSDVSLVRIEEEDDISEEGKSTTDESMASDTSRDDVSVESVDRVTDPEAVDETSSQRNKVVSVERMKKRVGVVDKDYMSYLTWLVDSIKHSTTTKQIENLQKDQSVLDPPVSKTPKEFTIVHEKEPLVKVKEELVFESWSDDDDIIAVSDSPFLDGEVTPFVASKKAVDLDEDTKEDGNSRLYKEKLMDILKKPYNERELGSLSEEVSVNRVVTGWRRFRKGKEKSYPSEELGPSYLERYSDFDEEYKLVEGVDKAKALKLLRGFFFYLENVSHDGAFKPWDKNKQYLLS